MSSVEDERRGEVQLGQGEQERLLCIEHKGVCENVSSRPLLLSPKSLKLLNSLSCL